MAAGRPERSSRAAETAGPELLITRVFDAPRALVWKAWTDPEQAKRWWGPKGFSVVALQMEVRSGGTWSKCVRSPDGAKYWRRGVYKEIVEPGRLVFTYVSDDPRGNPGDETLVTVTFEELGAKTRLTFHQAVFDTVESRDAHQGGWTSCLERFAEYLAKSKTSIVT